MYTGSPVGDRRSCKHKVIEESNVSNHKALLYIIWVMKAGRIIIHNMPYNYVAVFVLANKEGSWVIRGHIHASNTIRAN